MPNSDLQTKTAAREPRPVPAADETAPVTHLRAVPVLATLIGLVLAALAFWAMWQAYMAAPWTRDGTVRAYVVKITPEVSGRIVQLPIADNQFVRKGDLLMAIDPSNYAIAVELAQAAADQANADAENARGRRAARAADEPVNLGGGAADLSVQSHRCQRGSTPGCRKSGPSAGQSRAHDDPLPG